MGGGGGVIKLGFFMKGKGNVWDCVRDSAGLVSCFWGGR